MKTISIRDIRAPQLRQLAAEGTPAAITDNRVLAGIFCPITQDWLAQMLTMNRSRLKQSLREGEKDLANLDRLPALDSLDDPAPEQDHQPAMWNPFEALQDAVAAFMPALPGHGKDEHDSGSTGHRTVRIGDLSAAVIRESAQTRQTVAVTDRRELIGIIVPVSDQLMGHVLEDNLSRIRRNLSHGERELQTSTNLPTLDDLA